MAPSYLAAMSMEVPSPTTARPFAAAFSRRAAARGLSFTLIRMLPLLVAAGIARTGPAAAASGTNGLRLAVATDRGEAPYRAGEMVKFQVGLTRGCEPVSDVEASFMIGPEGMPPEQKGTIRIGRGTASLEGTLKAPGFLQCRVSCAVVENGARTNLTALAGAGFDPLSIKPSLPVPGDFDAFWTGQKKRLAAVPMKPELTPVDAPVPGVECFDAQIPCVPPRPVSGYFARPQNAKKGKHPAMLFVHGAGVRGSILASAAGAAQQFGALAMDINAHGIPNGKPKEFYEALDAGELKMYRFDGREDREKCYFLGMFLRLVRAMEFLKSQPEWDGKVLIVRGSSQGGGQSIAAAGLDPLVTFISAGVPAICDHSGRAAGRVAGWPKLVPETDGRPDPKILEVARYFDGMNFATRARAEGVFDVGLIDTTCPPSSVYAAYNNWPGKKEMLVFPEMGHATAPRFSEETNKAIAAHLARMAAR